MGYITFKNLDTGRYSYSLTADCIKTSVITCFVAFVKQCEAVGTQEFFKLAF